jgi:hypothetical protein
VNVQSKFILWCNIDIALQYKLVPGTHMTLSQLLVVSSQWEDWLL